MSVALATSHALDKNIEAQSLWNLEKVLLIKAKLSCLVVTQDSYLGKFLSIWVQFVYLVLFYFHFGLFHTLLMDLFAEFSH